MLQSPKNKRPHAASERESVDNVSESSIGKGATPQQGPSGSGKPTVPAMSRPNQRGSSATGNTARHDTRKVTARANMGTGSPGRAERVTSVSDKHEFSDNLGRNG